MSNLKIKQEPFSPSTPSLSSSDDSSMYSVVCTGTNSETTDNFLATHSACSPPKRCKSESEEPCVQNPETKNKLKEVVLQRRIARGDVDPPSNLFEEPKVDELTPADLDKRQKRKLQNREAAKRCRAKKKEQQHKVAQDTARVAQSNEKLLRSLNVILQEVQKMNHHLLQHVSCGECKLTSLMQEEHKQHICDVLNQLKSLVQTEQLLQQACTDTDVAVECAHEDEVFEENYRSPDNSNSNSELESCTLPSDVHIHHAITSADVSAYIDGNNLQSWDLENINPDIPATGMDSCLSQSLIDDSINGADSIGQLCIKIPEDMQQVSVMSTCMRGLTEDIYHKGQTDDATSYVNLIPAICHEEVGISYPNIQQAEHSQWVPSCTQSMGIAPQYHCVSPNLVQSVSTTSHSVMHLSEPIRGIHRPTRSNQLIPFNADVNNNGSCGTAPDKSGSFYSFAHRNPLNVSGRLPDGVLVRSQYFTFDCHDPILPVLEASGIDPVSPFYTQGGNSRI